MRRLLAFCATIMLCALAPAAVVAPPLERLAPDGALADIQGREGVVFVDLFADW